MIIKKIEIKRVRKHTYSPRDFINNVPWAVFFCIYPHPRPPPLAHPSLMVHVSVIVVAILCVVALWWPRLWRGIGVHRPSHRSPLLCWCGHIWLCWCKFPTSQCWTLSKFTKLVWLYVTCITCQHQLTSFHQLELLPLLAWQQWPQQMTVSPPPSYNNTQMMTTNWGLEIQIRLESQALLLQDAKEEWGLRCKCVSSLRYVFFFFFLLLLINNLSLDYLYTNHNSEQRPLSWCKWGVKDRAGERVAGAWDMSPLVCSFSNFYFFFLY